VMCSHRGHEYPCQSYSRWSRGRI